MNGEIIGKELCLGVSSAALVSFSQFVPCYVYVCVCLSYYFSFKNTNDFFLLLWNIESIFPFFVCFLRSDSSQFLR